MSGRLLAVCVSGSDLLPLPGRRPDRSGIDKRPVAGRVAVHPLGLDGDVQVNRRYHGGEGQALYAYAQEDADWWEAELGRELPDGMFGENLTTAGLDLVASRIGEVWRVGDVLELQPTFGRIPCATFQAKMGEPRWVRTFTAESRPGAYLRVITPGDVRGGDPVEVVDRPAHGVTIALAFRAYLTERHLLPELLAIDGLPDDLRATLRQRMGGA